MISVQQTFGQIVVKTNTVVMPKVLANLQTVTGKVPKVTELNYQYGHDKEITNKIQNWTQSAAQRYKNFPLVWLREDIRFQTDGELRYVEIPSLIIAMDTQSNYESSQRETNTFNPVLRPIYYELLQQIYYTGDFRIGDPIVDMPHRMIEHKFWGTPEDTQVQNVFKNFVDAIEIENLRLLLEPDCSMIID